MHAEGTTVTTMSKQSVRRRRTPATNTRRAHGCRLRVIAGALGVVVTIVATFQSQTAPSSAQAAPDPVPVTTPVPVQPAVAETVRPPRVAFVGDSIGHSAEAEVTRSFDQAYRLTSYDAVDGSTTAEHLAKVAALVHGSAVPDVIVIELGTNDAEHHEAAQFEQDLRTMLDLVSPQVREVRWLDQKDTPTYYAGVNAHAAEFNAILRRVVAEYPNVEAVDYASWARTAPAGSFLADLLHLTPLGRQQLATIARDAADDAAGELPTAELA